MRVISSDVMFFKFHLGIFPHIDMTRVNYQLCYSKAWTSFALNHINAFQPTSDFFSILRSKRLVNSILYCFKIFYMLMVLKIKCITLTNRYFIESVDSVRIYGTHLL